MYIHKYICIYIYKYMYTHKYRYIYIGASLRCLFCLFIVKPQLNHKKEKNCCCH